MMQTTCNRCHITANGDIQFLPGMMFIEKDPAWPMFRYFDLQIKSFHVPLHLNISVW